MSYLPLAKAIVLGVYEIASELLTERRKARARREAEKAVGLSHRDVEHQQAQIRSAARPAPKP